MVGHVPGVLHGNGVTVAVHSLGVVDVVSVLGFAEVLVLQSGSPGLFESARHTSARSVPLRWQTCHRRTHCAEAPLR